MVLIRIRFDSVVLIRDDRDEHHEQHEDGDADENEEQQRPKHAVVVLHGDEIEIAQQRPGQGEDGIAQGAELQDLAREDDRVGLAEPEEDDCEDDLIYKCLLDKESVPSEIDNRIFHLLKDTAIKK